MTAFLWSYRPEFLRRLRFNFTDPVGPVETRRILDGLRRYAAGGHPEYTDHANRWWLLGRSRRERLLLAMAVFRVGVGRRPVVECPATGRRLEAAELPFENLDRLVAAVEDGLGLRELRGRVWVGPEALGRAYYPAGDEWVNFLYAVLRLGGAAPQRLGLPPATTPAPSAEHARALAAALRTHGEAQGYYNPAGPGKPYPMDRLSADLKLFIAWWRRAILDAYGLSPPAPLIDLERADRMPLPAPELKDLLDRPVRGGRREKDELLAITALDGR